MQRRLSLHGAARCPLSSMLQRTSASSRSSVFASHRQAQGMHQHIAPKDDGIRYDYIENGEPLGRYLRGGYHPVSINDVLHQRYHIVHKLGFGGHSTIWLAKDTQRQDKLAAIKIKISEADHDSTEERIWHHLWAAANAAQSEDGAQQLALSSHTTFIGARSMRPIWDEFTVDGPNGTHRCIVTDPARMTVAEAQEASYNRLFQPNVARAIAAQLIEAVAFTHTSGYVHADLHLGNVLLGMPKQIAEMPADELYKTFGSPVLEPVTITSNETKQSLPVSVPSHIVIPAWLGTDSEDVKLDEASVILSDFGEAFAPSTEQRHQSNTPIDVRPPECRFAPEKPLSFAADIWTLACSIWSILGQRPVFDTFNFWEDDVTKEQVIALGKLPQDWWERWDTRSREFDGQGNRLGPPSRRRNLDDRFEYSIQQPRRDCGMATVSDEEKVALLGMLRAMLAYNPEERPTAASLVDCEWMVKWAFPDLHKAGVARTESTPDQPKA